MISPMALNVQYLQTNLSLSHCSYLNVMLTVPEPRTKTGKIKDFWTCTRESNEGFEAWDVRLDNKVFFGRAGNIAVNAEMKDEILVRNSSLFTISYPEINRFEVKARSCPAVVDSYYLIKTSVSRRAYY